MSTSHKLVMQAKGLVKRYGQVTALDGADFELRAGEILAVIGDNGAGKSSLIKCLSGATIPDEGEMYLDGQKIHFNTPIDARRAGIECCYQDLAVAPAMTITENLFLGREMRREGFLGVAQAQIDGDARIACTQAGQHRHDHVRPIRRHLQTPGQQLPIGLEQRLRFFRQAEHGAGDRRQAGGQGAGKPQRTQGPQGRHSRWFGRGADT